MSGVTVLFWHMSGVTVLFWHVHEGTKEHCKTFKDMNSDTLKYEALVLSTSL